MRIKFLVLLIIAFSLTITACKKDSLHSLNCEALKEGLATENQELIKKEINLIVSSFSPDPSADDKYGHRKNLNSVAETLSAKCNITSSNICYNCIETNPPQSEVQVSFMYKGIQNNKVIDISYTKDNTLTFVGMHN